VTAEGGPDAAVEAPYIWVAQDLLATRAAGAAERRQRALLATMPPAMAAELPSPQEAGAIAARAVKQARARFLLCIGVRRHRSGLQTCLQWRMSRHRCLQYQKHECGGKSGFTEWTRRQTCLALLLSMGNVVLLHTQGNNIHLCRCLRPPRSPR